MHKVIVITTGGNDKKGRGGKKGRGIKSSGNTNPNKWIKDHGQLPDGTKINSASHRLTTDSKKAMIRRSKGALLNGSFDANECGELSLAFANARASLIAANTK